MIDILDIASIKTDYPETLSGTSLGTHLSFTHNLEKVFKNKKSRLHVLDLNCGNGAFVNSCLKRGYFAVGISGSFKGGFWATFYKTHLFTADITKPFQLHRVSEGVEKEVKFDLIAVSSVKISDEIIANIKNHLCEGGLLLSDFENVELLEKSGFTRLPQHETLFKTAVLTLNPTLSPRARTLRLLDKLMKGFST